MKDLLGILIIGFLASTGEANQEYRFEETTEQVHFYADGEASRISSSLASLTGFGIGGRIVYGLSHRQAINFSISAVYDLNSLSSIYFTIVGSYEIAIRGGYIDKVYKTVNNNRVISYERVDRGKVTSIGVGLEQMLFNGQSTVYSGTGACARLSQEFNLFSTPLSASLRYSALKAKNSNLTVLGFSLGLGF